MKNEKSIALSIRYENVKKFWTQREYDYQELIINGIVVHRETPGKTLRTMPFARIDIFYDSPDGIGRKSIRGVEFKVYREAAKFLSRGEVLLLNDKWRAAKYEGKYTHDDLHSRQPIYDNTIPNWISGKKTASKKLNRKQEASLKILDKKISKAIEESFYLPKEKKKESPLQDLFLTKDIDPKEVAGDEGLSTLYKHIKGDRELSKGKAIEYAKTLGVAPASLMFEPIAIPIWSYVKFSEPSDVYNSKDGPTMPGVCYSQIGTETEVCPQDIYRVDIEGIKIKDKKSIYDGFVAYYYKTDKILDQLNNKLCLIREQTDQTLLSGHYKYYLGICQLYGTEIRVLNPDPTSKFNIIANDVKPDLVAPIISFTRPDAVSSDKVLSTNIKNVQNLARLIREEEENKKKLNQVVLEKQTSLQVKEMERLTEKLTAEQKKLHADLTVLMYKFQAETEARAAMKKSFLGGLLSSADDDIKIPGLLKKDEKKRA